ncbi:IQ motif and ankyrin repeat domain-containing protein 1-like isoform X2 [Oncorhynchus keta]|uniref:IQ motif and ankyrin repeat domain-containing protein 1-like isoform X2 n=1 Tax=Oncorhynchus keta TaxID=8018 RepID=UPI00227A414B|nr:IQ motif and ankyrin repeat domain-containing protein 1-like isoform X2 [Oncorhynchus keta]
MSSRSTKSPGKTGAKARSKGAVQSSEAGASPQRRQSNGVTQGGQSKGKAAAAKTRRNTSAKTVQPPKKNVELTPEELAAVTIQRATRGLLARRERVRRQKEKQDYEDLMDRLEKEAFVALVRREQEEAEWKRKKEEEERKGKKEEQLLRTRLLEAAFDGEAEEVLAILKEVSDRDTKRGLGLDEAGKRQRLLNQLFMINITDANGNTAVSEAAGGGQPEVITLLVERGADINTRGAFGRTPIYRAAFGGHLWAVQTLLQLGADPRIHADDGSTPEQNWDLSATDSMLSKMKGEEQRRAEEEEKQNEAQTERGKQCKRANQKWPVFSLSLKGEVDQLQKEHERCQRELQKAFVELNKRITEHDTCVRKGMEEQAKVTLLVVHEAEDVLAKAQIAAHEAAGKLSLAKLTLREQSGGDAVLDRGGVRCPVRDLEEVLIKDVGGKIKQDGRWPLLVDTYGQAATFLRYRDTNYLDALHPGDMQPDKLRLALLGAIRFGKPLVINMMEVDLFESVQNQLDQVNPGLSEQLMNKELLQEERYLSLVRSTDGPQYARTEFMLDRIEKFSLVLVTKQRHPPDALLTAFYPIHVMLPEPKI